MAIDLDVDELNAEFGEAAPEAILRWSWENLQPDLALSSSFQTQSVPLLHLVSRACPAMPVLFLDTGFHFAETLRFRDELTALLGLNVRNLKPHVEKSELFRRYGEGLYRRDPDLCCHINKVQPLEREVQGLRALISGVRHDQTRQRAAMKTFEWRADGILKIHPILRWTKRDVWTYLHEHKLPEHPLLREGYLSIGCAPCTRPVTAGEDERSGRWAHTQKTECGIHTNDTNSTEVSNDKHRP